MGATGDAMWSAMARILKAAKVEDEDEGDVGRAVCFRFDMLILPGAPRRCATGRQILPRWWDDDGVGVSESGACSGRIE